MENDWTDVCMYVFIYLFIYFLILDIIHPFLGQLPVGKTPSNPAANLYRSDKDSWIRNSSIC